MVMTGCDGYMLIWVFADYPTTALAPIVMSEYYWCVDPTFPPCWFHASYTGTYYFLFRYNSGAQVDYNITINVTTISTRDSYNDRPSAVQIVGDRKGENASMPEDYFDWFKPIIPDSECKGYTHTFQYSPFSFLRRSLLE